MTLRPYQLDAIDDVRAHWAAGHRSVCLSMSTGSGKTHTAAAILAGEKRAIFVARLSTLVSDTHRRLTAAGIRAGYVAAGRPVDPDAAVQVCSEKTLTIRGERPPADLVVIDECHGVMASGAREIVASYPDARILGLTATPQRGDGQPLGDVFSALVMGPSMAELTAEGSLVPCRIFAGSANHAGLAQNPAVALWPYRGKRAIVFVSSCEEARKLAERIPRSAVLLGDTPNDERDRLIRAVEAGELDVLIGVSVFVEGFDLPSIEVVVLARSFGVCGPYLQAIGRGLRPSPGKTECVVLDLCGSVYQHGLPVEARTWSLTGKAVKREQLTAISRCVPCGAIFQAAKTCPRCGETRDIVVRKPPKPRSEVLEEIAKLSPADRDARVMRGLLWAAKHKARIQDAWAQRRWAVQVFAKKYGRQPEGVAA